MNNRFAERLYQATAADADNFAISPFSIAAAMALPYAGASGTTRTAFEDALGFQDPAVVAATFDRLLDALNDNRKEAALVIRVANGIWVRDDIRLHDAFRDTVTRSHRARVETADFRNQPGVVRDRINAWVAEATETRIPQLIPPAGITRDTGTVLVNALYFKGPWETPFSIDQTRPMEFHTEAGETIEVDTMYRRGRMTVAEAATHRTLALRFDDDRFEMLIWLPQEGVPLGDVAAIPLADRLDDDALQERDLKVYLPRFRIRTTLPLKDGLTQLGLHDAFTRHADFSGIGDGPELFISDVFHETFLEVAEGGVEAAAATGVAMEVTSMPPVFRADRPFLFALRHRPGNAVLFLGQVTRPEWE